MPGAAVGGRLRNAATSSSAPQVPPLSPQFTPDWMPLTAADEAIEADGPVHVARRLPVLRGNTPTHSYEECRVAEQAEVGRGVSPAKRAGRGRRRERAQQLTVVVMSFQVENHGVLDRLICNYEPFDVVRNVLLVWNNVDEPPPQLRCTRKLIIKRQQRNTLVNRYREWPHIATRAVLLSDDDLTMCEEGVNAMLRVWSEHPTQMVGVGARKHRDLSDRLPKGSPPAYQYQEGGLDPSGKYRAYSMMTGRLNLLHRRYLRMFMQGLPRHLVEYVHTHKPTCEDMLLSFMVSNHTGLPPIHLRGIESCRRTIEPEALEDTGASNMHASVTGWNMKRTLCLNRLHGEFGRMPLVLSSCNVALNASQTGGS